MRRERWYQLVAFALLIAQACACAAAAPASSQAAVFDTLFKRLDGGEIATLSAQQLPQRLTELQRLVPAGDVVRELRYRSMHCDWSFDNDAKAVSANIRCLDRPQQLKHRCCDTAKQAGRIVNQH